MLRAAPTGATGCTGNSWELALQHSSACFHNDHNEVMVGVSFQGVPGVPAPPMTQLKEAPTDNLAGERR